MSQCKELEDALRYLFEYTLDLEYRLGTIAIVYPHMVGWKESDYEVGPRIRKILNIAPVERASEKTLDN